MDPVLGLLFVAGVIWASKNAVRKGWADFRKSRAGKPGGPWQHAAAWWAREASHGFPVHRAGFSQGWLAHQTALAQRQARREETRTSHLEARASIASEWAEHRRRQAEAQALIDEAGASAGGHDVAGTCIHCRATDGNECALDCPYRNGDWRTVARNERKRAKTRRVDGQPETEADTRFFDKRESGYDGPLDRDGNVPDPSDPQNGRALDALRALRNQAPPSPEGIQHMATPTEGSYTTVIQAAKEQAEQADSAAADMAQQWATAEQILEEMQSANVDAASLSDQADHVARLRAAEQAVTAVTESGEQVSSGLAQRHGGIKEAHDDAPVPAAESGFYED